MPIRIAARHTNTNVMRKVSPIALSILQTGQASFSADVTEMTSDGQVGGEAGELVGSSVVVEKRRMINNYNYVSVQITTA